MSLIFYFTLQFILLFYMIDLLRVVMTVSTISLGVTFNNLRTGGQTATVKRRKKSTATPNPKKMFEEAQMVRRVKAYLGNMKVVTDEDRLHQLSVDCEPHPGTIAMAAAVPLGGSRGRRNASPTLSTTSSASSTSEGRKSIQGFQPCSIDVLFSSTQSHRFSKPPFSLSFPVPK